MRLRPLITLLVLGLALAGCGSSDPTSSAEYEALQVQMLSTQAQLDETKAMLAEVTAPGGSFPLNTNGGGLSYTHPGMYGIFTVVEAVRQLRGETGERQLEKCDLALAHGTGGLLSSTGTVVLGRS